MKNKEFAKKNIILLGIVAVAIIACTIGTIVWMNTGSRLVDRQLSSGEKYISMQSYNEAVIAFNKVIEVEPTNVDGYLGLAEAYVGLGNSDKAIEILHDGLVEVPDSEQIKTRIVDEQIARGAEYTAEGSFNEAIIAYEDVLKYDPSNMVAYLSLADTYINKGNTNNAINILHDGLNILPGSDNIRAKLVETEISWGNDCLADEAYSDAITAFEDVIINDTDNMDAKICLVDAYLGNGDTNKAIETLVAAIDEAPQMEVLYTKLINAYERSGDIDSAIQVLENRYNSTGSDQSKAELDEMKTYNTRGNTIENINNGGYVAEQGDWIYYSRNANNPGSNLYKIHKDGTGKTLLSTDTLKYINVIGDWIYYQSCDENENIYKIRTDGTEKTKVNNDRSHYVYVVGNWIYYSDFHESLYKIKTDGTCKTEICYFGMYDHFCVVDDWIYYVEGQGTFNINTDGDRTTWNKIHDDNQCDQMLVYNNYIFYMLSYHEGYEDQQFRIKGIFKVSTKGMGMEEISIVGDWVKAMNISDGYIYYSDETGMYKIRADGTHRSQISKDSGIFLNIIDGWLYYRLDLDGGVGDLYKIHLDGTGKQLAP